MMMEHNKQQPAWKGWITFVLAIGVTLAVCVMTTIMLTVGQRGEVDRSLAILSIDTGNFAKFNPPRINITGKALPKREEAFKLIDVRAPFDIGEVVDSVGEGVGDAVEKGSDATDDFRKKGEQAANDIGEKAGSLAKDIEQKAGALVDDIGDKIEDLEQIVKKVFEKVLGEIEEELNTWLRSVARDLALLDIAQRYSLHVTTYCKVPRLLPSEKDDASKSTAHPAKEGTFNSTTGPAECTQFFGGADEDEKFDAAKNGGKILGFPPGTLVARVMGLFLIPEEIQARIKKPIDDGANKAQSVLHDAQNTLKGFVVHITFLPTLIFYAMACGLSWIMLVVLLLHLASTKLLWLSSFRRVPYARIYKYVSLIAAFCLFLGAMIVTVVHFMAKVVDIAAGVVKISVQSGGAFVTMSWVSCLLLVGLRIIARRLNNTPLPQGHGVATVKEHDEAELEPKPGVWGRFLQGKPKYPPRTPQKSEFTGS